MKSNKAVLALSLIMTLILGSGVSYMYIENTKISSQYSDFKEKATNENNLYRNRIDNLENQNSNLSNELDLLYEEYDALGINFDILRRTYDTLDEEYGLLRGNYDNLGKEYGSLETNYHNLRSIYSSLDENFNDLVTELEETITMIEDYETEIRKSMEWFRTNSVLEEEFIEPSLDTCIRLEGDTCRIKTGCIHLVNAKLLEMRYIPDLETSNQRDKMQNLSSIFKNKGGDCEDFSLLYKAQWNYLMEQCGNSKIVVEGWESSTGDKYALDYEQNWLKDNAKAVVFSDYKYPSIVCGNMFDPNSGRVNGHCVVAFTKKEIKSVKDLSELDKALLIEPQNGKYLGLINDKSSEVSLRGLNNQYSSYIYQVITNNDHFAFSNSKWQSYSGFLQELATHRMNMQNLAGW
jgi:hypothetical protein